MTKFFENVFENICGMCIVALIAVIMMFGIAIAGPETPGYEVLEYIDTMYSKAIELKEATDLEYYEEPSIIPAAIRGE